MNPNCNLLSITALITSDQRGGFVKHQSLCLFLKKEHLILLTEFHDLAFHEYENLFLWCSNVRIYMIMIYHISRAYVVIWSEDALETPRERLRFRDHRQVRRVEFVDGLALQSHLPLMRRQDRLVGGADDVRARDAGPPGRTPANRLCEGHMGLRTEPGSGLRAEFGTHSPQEKLRSRLRRNRGEAFPPRHRPEVLAVPKMRVWLKASDEVHGALPSLWRVGGQVNHVL